MISYVISAKSADDCVEVLLCTLFITAMYDGCWVFCVYIFVRQVPQSRDEGPAQWQCVVN